MISRLREMCLLDRFLSGPRELALPRHTVTESAMSAPYRKVLFAGLPTSLESAAIQALRYILFRLFAGDFTGRLDYDYRNRLSPNGLAGNRLHPCSEGAPGRGEADGELDHL